MSSPPYGIRVRAVDDTGRVWRVLSGSVTQKVATPVSAQLAVVHDPGVDYPRRFVSLSVVTVGAPIVLGTFRVTTMATRLGRSELTLGGIGTRVQDASQAYESVVTGQADTVMQSVLAGVGAPLIPLTFAPGLNRSAAVWDFTVRGRWEALVSLAETMGGVLVETPVGLQVSRMGVGAPLPVPTFDVSEEWDRGGMWNAITVRGSGPAGEVWIAYAEDAASIAAYGIRVADPLDVQVGSADEVQDRAQQFVAMWSGWALKRTCKVAPGVAVVPGDTLLAGLPGSVEQIETPLGVEPQTVTLANMQVAP